MGWNIRTKKHPPLSSFWKCPKKQHIFLEKTSQRWDVISSNAMLSCQRYYYITTGFLFHHYLRTFSPTLVGQGAGWCICYNNVSCPPPLLCCGSQQPAAKLSPPPLPPYHQIHWVRARGKSGEFLPNIRGTLHLICHHFSRLSLDQVPEAVVLSSNFQEPLNMVIKSKQSAVVQLWK